LQLTREKEKIAFLLFDPEIALGHIARVVNTQDLTIRNERNNMETHEKLRKALDLIVNVRESGFPY
jgi:hypothetical protein